jgi:hypothetical protein
MQVHRRCGAEVGRVLAAQQPVMAGSPVTGSFGLSGRGRPAPVGEVAGSRTQSPKCEPGGRRRTYLVAGCFLGVCRMQGAPALRQSSGDSESKAGRSGWIEPSNGLQV